MRILQIGARFGSIGGIESYVKRLCERLTREGHEVALISNMALKEPTSYQFVTIPGYLPNYAPVNQRDAEADVLKFAAKFQPDVVLSHTLANPRLLAAFHASYPTADFVHTFLCGTPKMFRRDDSLCTHRMGPRCLVDWYLGPCGSQKSPLIALETHRTAMQHIDVLRRLPGVLVATDYMRDYLIDEGVAPERVHVAEYTLGIPPEQPVVRTERPTVTLLYVGRLTPYKGVQYALDALTRLDKRYRLLVVGDGFHRARLEAKMQALKLQDRVEFIGFLQGEALQAVYSRADIAITPSIWPEPAGLVVPEARAHGLPVVAFAMGGIPEWASRYGYDAIYLAERRDPDSLAEAICRAAGDAPIPAVAPRPGPMPVLEALKRALDTARAIRN